MLNAHVERKTVSGSPGVTGNSLPVFCCSGWSKPAVWIAGPWCKIEVSNYVIHSSAFGHRLPLKDFSMWICKPSVLTLMCIALQLNDQQCWSNLSTLNAFLCKLCFSLRVTEVQFLHTVLHSQFVAASRKHKYFHDMNLGRNIKDIKIFNMTRAIIFRSFV